MQSYGASVSGREYDKGRCPRWRNKRHKTATKEQVMAAWRRARKGFRRWWKRDIDTQIAEREAD